MKISNLALGENIQDKQRISEIRNALIGISISYSRIYCQQNKKEFRHLVYPFSSEDGSQRLYFFMSLVNQEKQFPNDTMLVNIYKASQFGETDEYKDFPLNMPTFIGEQYREEKEEEKNKE